MIGPHRIHSLNSFAERGRFVREQLEKLVRRAPARELRELAVDGARPGDDDEGAELSSARAGDGIKVRLGIHGNARTTVGK
jgi:hypothetical protein